MSRVNIIVNCIKTTWAFSSITLIGKGYYDLFTQYKSKKI